jgi:hypothetical protein
MASTRAFCSGKGSFGANKFGRMSAVGTTITYVVVVSSMSDTTDALRLRAGGYGGPSFPGNQIVQEFNYGGFEDAFGDYDGPLPDLNDHPDMPVAHDEHDVPVEDDLVDNSDSWLPSSPTSSSAAVTGDGEPVVATLDTSASLQGISLDGPILPRLNHRIFNLQGGTTLSVGNQPPSDAAAQPSSALATQEDPQARLHGIAESHQTGGPSSVPAQSEAASTAVAAQNEPAASSDSLGESVVTCVA